MEDKKSIEEKQEQLSIHGIVVNGYIYTVFSDEDIDAELADLRGYEYPLVLSPLSTVSEESPSYILILDSLETPFQYQIIPFDTLQELRGWIEVEKSL